MTWVFPLARVMVNVAYYLAIFSAAVYLFISMARILNLQPARLTFSGQTANSVYIPVDWKKKGDTKLTLPENSLISLHLHKRKGDLQVPARSPLGLSYTFITVLVLVGFVWFFGILRQIFRHTRADSPFHPDNARRIGQMGWLYIAALVFSEISDFVVWAQAKPYIEAMSPEFYSGQSYGISLDGSWTFGLVLLALAQIYRRGVELQQENELTV